MKQHHIATVINYCTNDYRFIGRCVHEVLKFSSEIVVPYCDHFYDGTVENKTLLDKTFKENRGVTFVPIQYDPHKTKTIWRGWAYLLRKLHLGNVFGPTYWLNNSRIVGWHAINKKCDYVLFLDADEIVDGERFLEWLRTGDYTKFNMCKLANYWYFRSPTNQATEYEDSPVLIRANLISNEMLMSHEERHEIFLSVSSPKRRMVLGVDHLPMVHHYGWAKSKQALLKKVKTWGHNKDRNWIQLIEKEFSHPFNGSDFIYKRSFVKVKPFI
jgi:hypothetical protein